METHILLVGTGILADTVQQKLSTQYHVSRQRNFEEPLPKQVNLALVLHDGSPPSLHHKAETVFRKANIPWLRGFVSFGEGIIGPLVQPGTPGCSHCADVRRLIAGYDRKEMWELQRNITLKDDTEMQRDAWASQIGLLQMSQLIYAETEKIVTGHHANITEKILILNMKTLQCSRHFFLSDSRCPMCSILPNDSPVDLSLQPSPKINRNSYRCRSMEELQSFLNTDYVDGRTGIFNKKITQSMLPFADVVVNMPMLLGNEGVAGRTHSYETSEATAILEGLERYCGMEPRNKKTVVHGCYRELQDQALNPTTVGVHMSEHYERPNFPFKPFHPERSIDWVWGYSVLQHRPILVPALLAYYSLGQKDAFVYETSNGCAVGGSIEEAIFHGILEVIERDSFLLTWYAQLPLPRLNLASTDDIELQLMIERMRVTAGYDLHVFNATMEHGIPSIWAIAKNTKQTGMNLICAGGAHMDPLRAVKSAIHELAGMLLIADKEFEANRQKYEQFLHDPFLVKQMEDHSMLYGLQEAEERLHFLLNDDRPIQTFEQMNHLPSHNFDLTEDLRELLSRLHSLNLDVIVINQTTPAIKRNGLHCVKVLIPGMLPMTFGHHLTRIKGLQRVHNVPMKLGYTKEPLTFAQLNPHPHPFP